MNPDDPRPESRATPIPSVTPPPQSHAPEPASARARAFRFVVLVGVVSMLADMTYEGARSIHGSFLETLGAKAAIVGIVAGAGELAGYLLRLVSGYLADRTRRYWTIIFLGYAVNVLAIPLLFFAQTWPAATVLILLERIGRAIRVPARDVLLASANRHIGQGMGFGLHEALDQIGACAGPLLVMAALTATGSYHRGYAMLLFPALGTLLMLLFAWRARPESPSKSLGDHPEPLPRRFWILAAAAALLAAAFADFPLIAYHLGARKLVQPWLIPLLYSIAMGVDAVAALVLGKLFDRHGSRVLTATVLLAIPIAWCAFHIQVPLILLGVVLWGIVMGAQESILRAAVAVLVPPARRGTAFGLFNAIYGISWFAGSALLGLLYDISIPALILASVLCVLASLPLFHLATQPPRASAAG